MKRQQLYQQRHNAALEILASSRGYLPDSCNTSVGEAGAMDASNERKMDKKAVFNFYCRFKNQFVVQFDVCQVVGFCCWIYFAFATYISLFILLITIGNNIGVCSFHVHNIINLTIC